MKNKHVFVYGTLMTGFGANSMLTAGATLLGPATVEGKMYDINGGFPGIILGEGSQVIGELYEVTDEAILPRLDNYEGHRGNVPSSLYSKHEVTTGNGYQATVYQFNHSVAQHAEVSDGDWRAHKRG